jgi:glutathione synthase/RimK-type ligase-like ATP-grasp enzyme
LRDGGVNLINPYDILCWNAEKTDLKDLESAGAIVVSTVIVPMNSKICVTDLLKERVWDRAVIKPTISGTSMHTWVTSPGSLGADQSRLEGLLLGRSMMLQEYLPEIETEGELSLIFFDGQFSHAVRKVPKTGDFRVQSDFGGSWSAVNPNAEVVRQSGLVLESVGHKSTYARVDMVLHEGSFLLMELEMIEPQLFLESDPGAPSRFARAIQNRLGDHGISQDI